MSFTNKDTDHDTNTNMYKETKRYHAAKLHQYQSVGKKAATRHNMNKKIGTTIEIEECNKQKLASIGKFGDSYDQIVNRIIDFDIKLTSKKSTDK